MKIDSCFMLYLTFMSFCSLSSDQPISQLFPHASVNDEQWLQNAACSVKGNFDLEMYVSS